MLTGLGAYWWRHRGRWAFTLASALGAVGCSLAMPPIIGAAIKDLTAGRDTLLRSVTELLVFAAGSALLYIVMRRSGATASRTIAYELRRDLFHRLTLLEPAYFHRTRTGDLMNRFTGDLSSVQEMLGFGSVQAVQTLLLLSLSLTQMLRVSRPLGLLVCAVFPVVVGLLVVMLKVTARRYAAVQEQQSAVSARAQENFSGMRVVKGYAMEAREQRDYERLNGEYMRRALSLARVEGPLWATVGLLMNFVFVAVLVVGARQFLSQPTGDAGAGFVRLSVGDFVTFIGYLFMLSWPLLSVGILSNILQRGSVSWGRLREILRAEPSVASPAALPTSGAAAGPSGEPASLTTVPGAESADAVLGELRFDHVSLTLGGRTLLEDLDLTIPKGKTFGITGRTGSGKTLLASLVPRLLDPTQGAVRVDGRDVREWPLAALREAIGVVTQEPFLFSTTLAENVGFGVHGPADAARLQWAVEVAGLGPDLSAFPKGLQTVIGERGVTLSGGQRQRTALARAVARKPAILILDDALSAVDTETETKILSNLREVLRGRTVLLIGHRVSMLRHADEIVVLEEGRIVERGTHEGLLARGGRYAELDAKQRLQRALEEQPAPQRAGG